MNTESPLVTVLTPVFNGAKYLRECIESVQAQTYQHFEYVIVNNCSSDQTLEIARSYAEHDQRIRIHNNVTFLNCEENHNNAFRLISPKSKYCKVVSADDWIAPDCLTKMVKLMEAHPTIAIVGSYQNKMGAVQWKGLPASEEVFTGREVCRMALIDEVAIFGPPTSVLYRSDLIRGNDPFFPTTEPHADTSACYEYLRNHDFGFVHEVLSTERVHDDRVTARARGLNMNAIAPIEFVLKYGPLYLNEYERDTISKRAFNRYYKRLGRSILRMEGRKFWKYHVSRMRELGSPISWKRVAWALISDLMNEIQTPKLVWSKFKQTLQGKGSIRLKRIKFF
jgi:glycosyltransferase involved in cell wall biosynthesis